MGGSIELALRRAPEPPEPVLDHFSYDRSIPDWPDAAQWSWRRQAAAERRRTDGHAEQPIVIVNPFCAAEQINVEAVCPTSRPQVDS